MVKDEIAAGAGSASLLAVLSGASSMSSAKLLCPLLLALPAQGNHLAWSAILYS